MFFLENKIGGWRRRCLNHPALIFLKRIFNMIIVRAVLSTKPEIIKSDFKNYAQMMYKFSTAFFIVFQNDQEYSMSN